MTTFSHPLNEQFSGSRRLPKPAEVEQYMDQFIVTDPYTLSGQKTFDQTISEVKDIPIDLANIWVGSSFMDGSVKPKIIPRGANLSLLPSSWNSIGPNIVSTYSRTNDKFRSINNANFTGGGQIHSQIHHNMIRRFTDYQSSQLDILMERFISGGYVAKRNEFDLLTEVKLRRLQYPGEQIYVLLGSEISDYMRCVYKTHIWNSAILVERSRANAGWGYRSVEQINEWSSAVFVKSQIKAAHSFMFRHDANRIPRRWEIKYVSVCKFALEVDKISEEEKVIVPKGLARFEFE